MYVQYAELTKYVQKNQQSRFKPELALKLAKLAGKLLLQKQ